MAGSRAASVQVITLPTNTEVPDINDDMARELAFYKQGVAAAHEAIARFSETSVSWRRPPDYYAESVKSDAHMAKIKSQLMYEQRMIEEAEQRCAASVWSVCNACHASDV